MHRALKREALDEVVRFVQIPAQFGLPAADRRGRRVLTARSAQLGDSVLSLRFRLGSIGIVLRLGL